MRRFFASPFWVVAVVAVGCGVLLLGVQAALSPRIERNRHLAQARLLLDVVGVSATSDAGVERAGRHLREEKDASGRLRRWVYAPDGGSAQAYLYPMEGKGLWGPLRGVVAVDPACMRIVGVRVFFHEETPGLGADIEKPFFLKRFDGRAFTQERERTIRLRVVKAGDARDPWDIDGISGATETTRGFDRMLRDALARAVEDRREENP